MIQLSSLVWVIAIFFAVVGFLRGWRRELSATGAIFLIFFILYQFDPILRNTIYRLLQSVHIFIIQSLIFLSMVIYMYRIRRQDTDEPNRSLSQNLLGGLVGFINGYIIATSLWYFLDINEYPIAQFIVAPPDGSISSQAISMIPIILINGGYQAGNDLILVIVMAMLFVALIVA
ncbi:hypothetical protein MASR2M15_20830 [Anaerolineales bacterium]